MGHTAIALTIDLEGSVSHLPQRLEFFLNLFSSRNVLATFFILGETAEAVPQLVKEISAAGHEVGFHGYRHIPIRDISPLTLEGELTGWRARLEDLAQKKVHGFRAPFFSVCRATAWALAVIAKAGFTYDASICPGISDRFGWLGAPQNPARLKGNGLIVFPVPVLSRTFPVGFSGGGYLRMFPRPLIAWGFRRQARARTPGMIYIHPWEIEISSTATSRRGKFQTGGWRESITGHLGRGRMRERFELLVDEYQNRLCPMHAVIGSMRDLPEWDLEKCET